MKRRYRIMLTVGLVLFFLSVFPLAKAAEEKEGSIKSLSNKEKEMIKEGKVEMEDIKRQKLLSKLEKITVSPMEFTDADIRVVIRKLMGATGVTIVLDENALLRVTVEKEKTEAPEKAKEDGKEDSLPVLKVTFRAISPTPLLNLLTMVLRGTGLGYKVEPNYIWISDHETLKRERLVTRIIKLRYKYEPSVLEDAKRYLA